MRFDCVMINCDSVVSRGADVNILYHVTFIYYIIVAMS